jgi:hypothetical protein
LENPSLNLNQSRNLINTQLHTLNKNDWKELHKRRRRGGKGIFTAEEADAGAGTAADTEAEAGSNLAELLGGNLRQPPEEALLNSSSAASQLLPHRLPLYGRRPLFPQPHHAEAALPFCS